ncbi:P-loop containing nucleoside triphosphate hydrolase protein [Laetiporus sulphureus 93-53]|uniref:p-loop containing nucleoside triphosphate hydrolase protein n=1 Tax=Laetiporus sulphureus 93-53 TaxID=1314785 RepID=A0A165B692_9APHY|nr:P-loop containing nucleoside triphosphate hydrolase protein [Laetiporus sulphureus 93-53]KZT00335.1 P-loop containing nucleoside triphosphate hydrolase protein [Laetiporus sulphureus 93-53]
MRPPPPALRRAFASSARIAHYNPIGLPNRPPPPTITRRIQKRALPHVKKVLAVASGKGGVGKSTVAVNLACALAMHGGRRVGILDLDIFGPSVPKLMGLEDAVEPRLTKAGAIVPLTNHGLPCMSMGFLLPRSPGDSGADTPVVWRGLMVQKAVQQLLFDVDWRDHSGAGLDLLVLDMPPGTGDVPLTLGQLVQVDGAVIVSTPQDVALADVRKGVAMFQKISVPITGLVLNQSHFTCPSCHTPHMLFGPPESFRATAERLGTPILGELPLVPEVSTGGDHGVPLVLAGNSDGGDGARKWREVMDDVAKKVWTSLEER